MTKRIAIIKGDFHDGHGTSWSHAWLVYCKRETIDHDFIAWRAPDALARMLKCDAVVWHFSHYSRAEMDFARSFLYAAKLAGLSVYPDFQDAWHFDDKIAQSLLYEAIKAPIPEAYCFFDMETLKTWVDARTQYPVVAKLKAGSGSQSVKLLHSREEILAYGKVMLKGKGLSSTPSLGFKAVSNLKSASGLKQIVARAKRVPEFLFTLYSSRQLGRESGYVYLQEFVPNDGFDLKVVTIGDKLSFIGRHVRVGDFRASGGGGLFFDRDAMTPDLIACAFEVADKMGSLCTGFDFAVNNETGKPVILEVSYGFSHTALLEAGGHFDRRGTWIKEPLNAPEEILNTLLAS